MAELDELEGMAMEKEMGALSFGAAPISSNMAMAPARSAPNESEEDEEDQLEALMMDSAPAKMESKQKPIAQKLAMEESKEPAK